MAQITIGTMEFANIRRAAQIVAPKVEANVKLAQKIAKLQEELNANNALISSMDGWVREKTGYGSNELVKRIVTDVLNEDGTVKVDAKTGYKVKKTEWVYNPEILTKLEKGGYVLETAENTDPAEAAPAEESVNLENIPAAPESEVFDPTKL